MSLMSRVRFESDSSDDDDSGFGDGLSADSFIQERISRMRNMMNLAEQDEDGSYAARSSIVPPVPRPVTLTMPDRRRQQPQHQPDASTTTATASAAPRPSAAPPSRPVIDGVEDSEDSGDSELGDDELALLDQMHAIAVQPAQPPPASQVHGATYKQSAQTQVQHSAFSDAYKVDEAQVNALVAEDDEEDDDDDDDGYTVTWTRGQLGLLFKANARGETVIRRVNKKGGSAVGLQLARAGDVLVAIDGVSVRGERFQELVERLRTPTFPVSLAFQPLKLDDDDEDDAGGEGEARLGRAGGQNGGVHTVMRASEAQFARKHSSATSVASSDTVAASSYETRVPPAPPVPQPQPSWSSAPAEDAAPAAADEYDVVWRQGSLGCGLKQRSGMPLIKSVTPGAAVEPSVQLIAPGDVMLLINGHRTEMIGFKSVVETLQRAPKPVYMRFRRSAEAARAKQTALAGVHEVENLRDSRMGEADMFAGSLSARQYTVLWKGGPLGVQIKARSSDAAVIVSKFTGTGDPELCAQIATGDVFVRIAGVEVAQIGIGGAYELLKTVQKPVVLVFERATASDAAGTASPASSASGTTAGLTTGTGGVDPLDPRESAVPSFRLLRERQAAARAQAKTRAPANGEHEHFRDSFSGFTPEQRGDFVFGAAGRRAVQAKHRPASYEYDIDERRSDVASHYSHPKSEHSEGSRGQGDAHEALGDALGYDDMLPRFSDIEMGRVATAAVSTLPPPPAYLDVFTQSGRTRDLRTLLPRTTSSPHSDGHHSSVSSGHGQAPGGAYGGHGHGHGYAPPPAYTHPPPPSPSRMSVGQYGATAAPPPPYLPQHGTRIDWLRQQYIQAERVRNQQRDVTNTTISTYSDLDDSGLLPARGKAGSVAAGALATPVSPSPSAGSASVGGGGGAALPPPELWIRWSEGPLGITFRRTNGQIVVSRLTGSGYSQGLEQLRAGDLLLSFGNPAVGSYSTSDLRLTETMDLIKKLPKPVDMCFVVR